MLNVLVLMAGESKAFFEAGYHYPKALIEVKGKPIIEHVLQNLSSLRNTPEGAVKFTFLVRQEDVDRFHLDSVLRLLQPEAEVMVLPGETQGAACSALFAIEAINNDEPLLIANGDQVLDLNIQDALDHFVVQDLDGGVVTFDSVHPSWSYVRVDGQGRVKEAAEKRPISRHATAGLYYFKQGSAFVRAAQSMIRKKASVGALFYVCPTFNELILEQAQIGIYPIDRQQYYSLNAPEKIEGFASFLDRKPLPLPSHKENTHEYSSLCV